MIFFPPLNSMVFHWLKKFLAGAMKAFFNFFTKPKTSQNEKVATREKQKSTA